VKGQLKEHIMRRYGIILSAVLTMSWALGAQQAGRGQQAQGQQVQQGQVQVPPPAGERGRGRGRGQADPRTAGGGQCSANPYNCIDTPNPLPTVDTVWLEEMTWMDVRDAMKAGKTTIIISTGGVEPNGPWLALGKHNYVLTANCDAIARKLGNALCAPIVKFVPEGNYEPKSGHMTTVGTITLTQPVYQSLLTDIVRSFKAHGFENIIMIGDSGGNGSGMSAVAKTLMAEWGGTPLVAHVPEHYTYRVVTEEMASRGLVKEGQGDGLHDDPIISMNMFVADPKSIRYDERVKIGKATINGVDLSDRKKTLEIGKAIVDFRATYTADAIRKAIQANKK
jgi:creatinine amidohydrolase/Fe(II)-dependent formamide hydrolase-like protein